MITSPVWAPKAALNDPVLPMLAAIRAEHALSSPRPP